MGIVLANIGYANFVSFSTNLRYSMARKKSPIWDHYYQDSNLCNSTHYGARCKFCTNVLNVDKYLRPPAPTTGICTAQATNVKHPSWDEYHTIVCQNDNAFRCLFCDYTDKNSNKFQVSLCYYMHDYVRHMSRNMHTKTVLMHIDSWK